MPADGRPNRGLQRELRQQRLAGDRPDLDFRKAATPRKGRRSSTTATSIPRSTTRRPGAVWSCSRRSRATSASTTRRDVQQPEPRVVHGLHERSRWRRLPWAGERASNKHDFDQIATIYSHLDSTTTIASAGAAPGKSQYAPGHNDEDGEDHFERSDHISYTTFHRSFGNGRHKSTHVFWALP